MLDPQLLGEEVLGAELIASRELTAAAGSLWETIERADDLRQQQLDWLYEDYKHYAETLLRRPDPLNWIAATMTLAGDRSGHIGDGWRALGKLIDVEVSPLRKGWGDFFEVVRRDWKREGGRGPTSDDSDERQPAF